MKKIAVLLLAFVLCFALVACGGKSEAATACETLISQIGEVTLNSGDAISAAESAYNALTADEKEQIPEATAKLTESRDAYDALVLQAKLDEVVAAIDAIGDVTLDSESAIAAAENAYNALSAAEQAMIAESGTKLASLRDAYNKAVMQKNADEVIASIDAIGTVTLDSQAAVDAAKALYNTLTAEEKALVSNYSVLEAAQTTINDLLAAKKAQVIKEYTSKFEVDEDKVESLTWYMHKKMPDYIDIRSYIIPYIGVKNGNPWICIRYNYTADDWVFWESLIIVVDGTKYTKNIGYFNTTRDNDNGLVWEYYDEPLNYNQAMDSYEIEMLRAIADSTETIIRFQGDDYHYDLVVNNTDKAIIRDVLALYEALL